MRLDELITLASAAAEREQRDLRDLAEYRRMEAIDTLTGAAREATQTVASLARAVLGLLAEDAPCGWEAPKVFAPGHVVGCREVDCDDEGGMHGHGVGPCVAVPLSWCSSVSPDDARALARMLLRAADSADEMREKP